jgi:hypothetical protein
MKYSVAYKGIFIILLFGLSGCNRIIDWGQCVFNQGENVDNLAKPAQKYLKSVTVYDQFATAGMFDALWLSDEVRTVYADLYAIRRCRDDEYKKIFLRRQLEENSHYISFIVLSLYDKPLGDSQSQWHVCLDIDGVTTQPIEVMKIELDPEYTEIFGKKLTRFKEPYKIVFNAEDVEGQQLIDANTQEITLVFKSMEKVVCMRWDIKRLKAIYECTKEADVCENSRECYQV